MKTALLLAGLAAMSMVGCGGSTDTQGAGSASGSGGGGGASASASSSASSSAGAGGASSSSASSSASTAASSSSSSSGGDACGTIDLTEDGTAKHFGSVCASSWGAGKTMVADGYVGQGPGMAGARIVVEGCASMAAMSPGIKITAEGGMVAGHYAIGIVSYTDMNGQVWGMQGDPFDATITKLDMVGGAIDGTFTAKVTQGANASRSLEGSFHVCRVMDELLP